LTTRISSDEYHPDDELEEENGEQMKQDLLEENKDEVIQATKKKKLVRNQELHQEKRLPEYSAYKYSNKGKGELREAVIVSGIPTFLVYIEKEGEIFAFKKIEEMTRVIKPAAEEEYPYEPYEFSNMEEVHSFLERAKTTSIYSLYSQAKQIAIDYNDQDFDKVVLLTIDIIWSYFQDRFPTTHYVAVIGDNGSGKSTVGDTFESVGYRVVNLTDPNAANICRILGSIEFGQCTIVADEAEKIDKQQELMSILKTGYQKRGKASRINKESMKNEFFSSYCFKMVISERMPNLRDAKGVMDRTLSFTTYTGDPKYDIKETLEPQGNPMRQKQLDRLEDFRKLMLIYRLLHFKDPISDVNVGVTGREKELSKPVIQLFYNTKVQKEVEEVLQRFLEEKSDRKGTGIEAALHPISVNLVSAYGNEISVGQLWQAIRDSIDGHYNENNPNDYDTADYRIIYRNSITNIICDKFGAKRKHKVRGNVLTFDPEKLLKVGKGYNSKTKIQTKISFSKAEGDEGYEGNIQESQARIMENSANLRVKNEEQETDNVVTSHIEPSEPSTLHSLYWSANTGKWGCKNCKEKGDKFDMQGVCKGK
jgi:hypothetical protein